MPRLRSRLDRTTALLAAALVPAAVRPPTALAAQRPTPPHPCVSARDAARDVAPAAGQPASIAVVTTASDAAAGRARAWVADTVAGRCLGYVESAVGTPVRWIGFAPRPSLSRVALAAGDGSVATRDAAVLALVALPPWTAGGGRAAAAMYASAPASAAETSIGGASAAVGAPTDPVGRRYVADFRKYADHWWSKEGANWSGNYYDRAWIYYQAWRRFGDPAFRERANLIAVDYREKYLEKNQYGSSPHWAQLEGLAEHYRVTGDTMSRVAVLRTADRLNASHAEGRGAHYLTPAAGESRIAARVLLSALLAWQVAPPAEKAAWARRVDARLAQVYAWQRPDGSFPADFQVCGGQLNYMVGLLGDALAKTHDRYRQDPKIVDAVKRAADYLWATQWIPSAGAFKYISVECARSRAGHSVGSPRPAADLNLLFVSTFGWLARVTGDATYRDRAEQIFASGVAHTYLAGSKQFNEAYTSSLRYLDYR